MMIDLTEKHVLVTGASRGLGRACVEHFHAQGARVSMLSRSAEELTAAAAQLGSRVAHFAGDIRAAADRAAAVEHFERVHGPVDVLINNAGVGAYRAFLDCSEEELTEQIATNFTGLVMLTHHVAKSMQARRHGTIVNVASDLARKPLAKMAVYAATKHALAGFSQSLTREMKEHGVRVLLLNPGIINTHFGGQTPRGSAEAWQIDAPALAEVIAFMVTRPAGMLLDEVTVHPAGQDF